jgi:YD repeat-containing protein
MTKILPALLALAMMTTAASAQQQRTLYDAGGNVVGRSATDSSGTTTNYDARGRVITRETKKRPDKYPGIDCVHSLIDPRPATISTAQTQKVGLTNGILVKNAAAGSSSPTRKSL